MIRSSLVALLILIPGSVVPAADSRSIWDEAAACYDRGDYSAAAEKYSKLIERGDRSPDLYYNLGNSYFKSERLGMSIWAYRRALKLDPGMEQARINLDYVRQFNIDKIEVKGGGFLVDIWGILSGMTSANGYLFIFSASWWLLGALGSFMILRPRGGVWPHYLLILGLASAIFTAAASITRLKHDRYSRWGVLIVPAADIREGPSDDFQRIEVGHEGLEFKILGERESSVLIELENGLKGWVASQTALEI